MKKGSKKEVIKEQCPACMFMESMDYEISCVQEDVVELFDKVKKVERDVYQLNKKVDNIVTNTILAIFFIGMIIVWLKVFSLI